VGEHIAQANAQLDPGISRVNAFDKTGGGGD
jgi:hypothetical protein